MTCDVLDIRCVLVNELIGNASISVLILVLVYFIWCIKKRIQYEVMIGLAFPIVLMTNFIFGGSFLIYILAGIGAAIMLAFLIRRLTQPS